MMRTCLVLFVGLSVMLMSGCASVDVADEEMGGSVSTSPSSVVDETAVQEKVDVKQEQSVKMEQPSGKILWIENFDAGVKTNLLGGDWGGWNKDPKDATQGCKEGFSYEEKVGDGGASLVLEYDVDSPNAAYNGFWMKLQSQDFSKYSKLVLYMKGDKLKGCTSRVKFELKNDKGEVGKTVVSGITDTWQKIEVPFNGFRGLMNFSSMKEFVIVFEDAVSSPKTGILYVDNIYVSE